MECLFQSLLDPRKSETNLIYGDTQHTGRVFKCTSPIWNAFEANRNEILHAMKHFSSNGSLSKESDSYFTFDHDRPRDIRVPKRNTVMANSIWFGIQVNFLNKYILYLAYILLNYEKFRFTIQHLRFKRVRQTKIPYLITIALNYYYY